MLTEPDLKRCRWLLRTMNVTTLYTRFGFTVIGTDAETTWMARRGHP